ncbi:MAG TPA: BON domain-containing protein, partial [Chloroflexota bacterium]|nr:BON domain-containing protein [Chloroflexota bacterium]
MAMNYAFGPSVRGPSAVPNWAYPEFYNGFLNPYTSYPSPPYPMPQSGGYAGAPFAPWYGTFPTSNAWTNFSTVVPETDDEIKYFVAQAIDNDPEVPGKAVINVDVQNGIVTLTGTV